MDLKSYFNTGFKALSECFKNTKHLDNYEYLIANSSSTYNLRIELSWEWFKQLDRNGSFLVCILGPNLSKSLPSLLIVMINDIWGALSNINNLPRGSQNYWSLIQSDWIEKVIISNFKFLQHGFLSQLFSTFELQVFFAFLLCRNPQGLGVKAAVRPLRSFLSGIWIINKVLSREQRVWKYWFFFLPRRDAEVNMPADDAGDFITCE